MSYAALSDLYTQGAPARAFGQTTPAQHQAALDARDAYINSKLRARYPDALPLIAPIDAQIVRVECVMAAWDIINLRGYDPQSGTDTNLRDRYQDALRWLDDVERQAAHPLIQAPPGQTAQRPLPIVTTSAQRGWPIPTSGSIPKGFDPNW